MTRKSEDEQLEILFWWMGGDSAHPIEAGLNNYLDETRPTRRRRLPWRHTPDREQSRSA